MTPNPKIRELIMSMGIIPESEHYDIAERVIRQCVDIAYEYDAPKMSGPGMIIAGKIETHFGVEESKGWICPKCGTDRTKQECPKGYTAALTGECPMIGEAQ